MSIVRHLIITGRVQGVGYRHFLNRTAHELHIAGWVRNRHDGSVEAVVSGTSEAVHALIERARRGPLRAMVSDVRVSDAQGNFEGFTITPTG